MNIINGINSGGAGGEGAPVKSDLCGVDIESVVTSGSRQRVQYQEMAASRKCISGSKPILTSLLVQVYQQGVELRQRTKVGLGLRGLG